MSTYLRFIVSRMKERVSVKQGHLAKCCVLEGMQCSWPCVTALEEGLQESVVLFPLS